MKENIESLSLKTTNWTFAILIWLLACLCLPFGESKSLASGSLYFNGTTNSYMQFTTPFSYGTYYTIEFWFRPDALASQNIFLYDGFYSSLHLISDYEISTSPDASISVTSSEQNFLGDSGAVTFNYLLNSGANLIVPMQWQHFAITLASYPPSAPGNPIIQSMYINGVLVSTNLEGNASVPFSFAANSPILGMGYSGEVCEFRFWNRPLSQVEIQTNMNQVLNPTNETGLIGYWRFTEGTNNIVYDLAGTNNGIIYGASWSSDLPAQPLQSPTIVQQPTNQIVSNGMANVMFNVLAGGSFPVFYQWMLNNSNILGATSSTYTITNAAVQDLGVYFVVITNLAGSVTSSNATLTMYPFLASPFSGTTAIWGQNANLSVGPAGTGPFFYQWYESGVQINGATNQTYTISSVQFTNAGFYSVVVSSALGSVTNTPAQLVVNPAGVSLGMYPGVTITGTVGYGYSIQSTPDLSNTNGWMTITNLTLQQTQQIWFDSSINAYTPANPQRFYRVVPQQ